MFTMLISWRNDSGAALRHWNSTRQAQDQRGQNTVKHRWKEYLGSLSALITFLLRDGPTWPLQFTRCCYSILSILDHPTLSLTHIRVASQVQAQAQTQIGHLPARAMRAVDRDPKVGRAVLHFFIMSCSSLLCSSFTIFTTPSPS